MARHRREPFPRASSGTPGWLLTSKFFGRTVSLGLLLSASSALAQTPGQQEDITLPPVDVRTQRRGEYKASQPNLFKRPDLIKDIPQSISVVPQELLREQAVFSLRDSLRNVTGITLNAAEGGVQGDNLTLRGYSARNDIYLDGIRDFGAYMRDTFNLESIEVLKGPSSVMFGRGSTGGVINQVSKTPHGAPSYEFSPTVGTGPLFRGSMDLNHPLSSSAAVRFNAMYHQADVPGRDEVEVQRFGVAPSFTIGLGGPTRLTLSYFYQHEDNIPDNGIPYLFGKPAPVSEDDFYGTPAKDFDRTNVHIATVRLEHDFSDDLRLRNTLRFANYIRDQEAVAPRIAGTPTASTPLSSIIVNRNQVGRERDDSILDNQTDLIVKFDTWRLKHTLVTGVELARETAGSTTVTVTGTSCHAQSRTRSG